MHDILKSLSFFEGIGKFQKILKSVQIEMKSLLVDITVPVSIFDVTIFICLKG